MEKYSYIEMYHPVVLNKKYVIYSLHGLKEYVCWIHSFLLMTHLMAQPKLLVDMLWQCKSATGGSPPYVAWQEASPTRHEWYINPCMVWYNIWSPLCIVIYDVSWKLARPEGSHSLSDSYGKCEKKSVLILHYLPLLPVHSM